jgi:hypothetical protein
VLHVATISLAGSAAKRFRPHDGQRES